MFSGISIFDILFNRSTIIDLLISCTICLACISFIPISYQDSESSTNITPFFSEQGTVFNFYADIGHGRHIVLSLPADKLIFKPVVSMNKVGGIVESISLNFVAKPEFGSLYHEIGNYNNKEKVVFVYPIFTQAAYGKNGFYYFYNGTCGSQCLTVPFPDKIKAGYSSSANGANVLNILNYSFITDITIDQNPDILKNYDKVIILHNEYVTQTEFNAITHHPNVVFLYPNALYAKVSTMTKILSYC